MKVSVLTEYLQKKLPFVQHGVSQRSQLPILLNFLIQAHGDLLTISATDLEIGIKTNIPAKVDEEGETTIPAKTFGELISSLPLEKINLVTTESGLEITSKKTKTTFQTIAKEEFPSLYEEKGDLILGLEQVEVEKAFKDVVFSASYDSNRPALSGVFINETEDGILFVATDGYRLSLKKMNKKSNGRERQILVPARLVKESVAIKEEDGKTNIFISEKGNQVLFEKGNTILVGRLIDAEFPKYERIIPLEYGSRTEFDREEMNRAIKTCAVFARETSHIIKLSLQKQKIIVSANTPSVGQNTVEIDAQLEGEENEIAFNARFLLDFFSTIESERVFLEMAGPLNPGVFKLPKDDSFLHLIMPIRVQG